MYTLAFDTTGSTCALILKKDGKIIKQYAEETEFGQAELLMTRLQKLVQDGCLDFSALDLLAVCTGPGSFTGVRSSVAAARAFALALPHTLVCGISAFEAYAESLPVDRRAEINAVLIETKREDFYFQCFNKKAERIEDPSVARYEDIIRKLSGHKVSLIGDGIERFLNKPSGLSLHEIELSTSVPIEALADCAERRYRDKTLDFPKPLYLKSPDVCVK